MWVRAARQLKGAESRHVRVITLTRIGGKSKLGSDKSSAKYSVILVIVSQVYGFLTFRVATPRLSDVGLMAYLHPLRAVCLGTNLNTQSGLTFHPE